MWRIILTALIIVGVIFYLGFTYENTLTCSLLYYASPSVANFFQCGYVIPAGTGPNGYIGNSTLKASDVAQYNIAPFVSNITKVQSGIKTWKSFANYTANQPSQLNAFNIYSYYTNTSIPQYGYYKQDNVYAFPSFIITETYYNNGSFSNYNPSLIGQVVNVSFVGGVLDLGIGHNNTPKHFYNLPYKITNMTLGSKGVVYWTLTENFVNNPTIISLNNISFANTWNTTDQPMGLHFANGTEVVLPKS